MHFEVTKKPTPAASATSPIKPIARPSPQSHRPLAAGALSSPRPAFAISSPSPLPLTPAGNIDLKQAWAMRGRSNSVSVSAPGAHANAPAILRPSALSQSAPTSPASPFTNLPRKEFTTKVNIDKFVSAGKLLFMLSFFFLKKKKIPISVFCSRRKGEAYGRLDGPRGEIAVFGKSPHSAFAAASAQRGDSPSDALVLLKLTIDDVFKVVL